MSAYFLSNPSPGFADKEPLKRLEVFRIGGITPFTTLDFPGCLAAVIYAQGCPWRCRYCYNSSLWPFCPSKPVVETAEAVKFVESRVGKLEAIVFSGGEATAQPGLYDWMAWVKTMPFKVGLETAGIYPEALSQVLPFCDFVAMDIKAPFHRYERVTSVEGSGQAPIRSLFYILESGVRHEFRMTWHPAIFGENDVLEAARELAFMGGKHFVLQKPRPSGREHDGLPSLSGFQLSEYTEARLHQLFETFQIRE